MSSFGEIFLKKCFTTTNFVIIMMYMLLKKDILNGRVCIKYTKKEPDIDSLHDFVSSEHGFIPFLCYNFLNIHQDLISIKSGTSFKNFLGWFVSNLRRVNFGFITYCPECSHLSFKATQNEFGMVILVFSQLLMATL